MPPLSDTSDAELAKRAQTRDYSAFEEIVRRYQTLLCSIAFSRCGNLATSEDIAQEAFWAAWDSTESLREPDKLCSWLCSIVRHLAADETRWKRSRREEPVREDAYNLTSDELEPSQAAIEREEEDVVWNALEEIPETYREPLVLYYREEQSVSEVAHDLGLTEDAVKQRLSRGRAILKDRVAEIVEGTLRRSRPTTAFTMAVMAGITASAAGKSVVASTGTAAGTTLLATAGKTALPGLLGGLAGGAMGLLGGYLGLAIPAQMASTRRERDYLMKAARRTTLVSIVAIVPFLLAVAYRNHFTQKQWPLITVGWIVLLNVYFAFEIYWITYQVRKIRQETPPESDPNITLIKTWIEHRSQQYELRRYRSPWEFCGLPILNVNQPPSADAPVGREPWTVGWIAIGGKARGVIAIGGVAQGVVCLGGVATGLVTCGGLSIGVLAFGGASLGVISIGGLAIGWQALGGGAIAWDLAVGGVALARRAADGGGAYAQDYAIGGSAHAAHANDAVAQAALSQEPLVQFQEWIHQHQVGVHFNGFVLAAVFALMSVALSSRKRPAQDATEES